MAKQVETMNGMPSHSGKFVPKIAKRITLSTLKFEQDVSLYVQLTRAFVEKLDTVYEKTKKDGEPSKTLHVGRVIDLNTGEEAEIVVPAVVLSTMHESYPNDAYVGKNFELCKLAKKAGKNYFPYRINELE